MIKTKHGTTEIEGSVSEILADFTIISRSIRGMLIERGMSVENADKKTNDCIERSKKSEEELGKELLDKRMERVLLNMFGGIKDAD